MNGLKRMMNTACKVSRPVFAGGSVDTPVIVSARALFTPIDPITTELQQRFALDTPHRLYQTYTECADVLSGDTLTTSAGDVYSVAGVDEWAEHGGRGGRVIHRFKVLALSRVEVRQ
jgi:hypothetical protein